MKTAGRVLATMIAMVAILLIAVGADKGLNYLERIKYDKECEELYAESHAQAEQLRTQLEELSQDEAAVETFLHEYAVDDLEDEYEDVLRVQGFFECCIQLSTNPHTFLFLIYINCCLY